MRRVNRLSSCTGCPPNGEGQFASSFLHPGAEILAFTALGTPGTEKVHTASNFRKQKRRNTRFLLHSLILRAFRRKEGPNMMRLPTAMRLAESEETEMMPSAKPGIHTPRHN